MYRQSIFREIETETDGRNTFSDQPAEDIQRILIHPGSGGSTFLLVYRELSLFQMSDSKGKLTFSSLYFIREYSFLILLGKSHTTPCKSILVSEQRIFFPELCTRFSFKYRTQHRQRCFLHIVFRETILQQDFSHCGEYHLLGSAHTLRICCRYNDEIHFRNCQHYLTAQPQHCKSPFHRDPELISVPAVVAVELCCCSRFCRSRYIGTFFLL